DALLQANPADRRKVFEEAAGIAGYRDQKASTERKLEIVASNLQRLEDKIGEAQSRLRSIKGQASRALKFREYTEKLRVLRTRMALKEFHRHTQAREDLLISVNDFGREEGRLKAALSAQNMESESIIARLGAGEDEVSKLRSVVHEAELAIGRDEGKVNEARARIEGLRVTAERLTNDANRLKGQIEELTRRREELAKAKAQGKGKLEEAESTLAQLQANAVDLQREVETFEKALTELREAHIAALHQRSGLMNEKLSIEAQQKSEGQRRFRLEQRASELCDQRDTLSAAKSKIEARADLDAQAVTAIESESQKADAAIAGFNQSLGELRGRRHQLELQVSGTESRIAHLEEIERMLEGVADGSRRLVQNEEMAARFGVQGLVADLLSADIKVAPALERALGGLGTGVVVGNAEQAFDAIDWLTRREGEACTVIVREHFEAKAQAKREFPTGQGIMGPLLKEVKFAPDLEAFAQGLIGDWLLVADRDVARRVVERHGSQWRMVTVTGEVFDAGAASLPSSDRTGGVITQRSELERLRREHERLVADLKAAADAITTKVEEAKAANERLANLRSEMQKATLIAVESKTELASLTRRVAALNEELAVIASEQEELWSNYERDQARLEEISEEFDAVSAKVKGLEAEISQHASKRADLESRRSEMTERLTAER
ncbi:MAG: hypothetical protein KDB07_11635, partial [Planctomycetes bacterium]|nr:hypothetical protein [Planctomycetota bacterium]